MTFEELQVKLASLEAKPVDLQLRAGLHVVLQVGKGLGHVALEEPHLLHLRGRRPEEVWMGLRDLKRS